MLQLCRQLRSTQDIDDLLPLHVAERNNKRTRGMTVKSFRDDGRKENPTLFLMRALHDAATSEL